jgi:hypothetical protein
MSSEKYVTNGYINVFGGIVYAEDIKPIFEKAKNVYRPQKRSAEDIEAEPLVFTDPASGYLLYAKGKSIVLTSPDTGSFDYEVIELSKRNFERFERE